MRTVKDLEFYEGFKHLDYPQKLFVVAGLTGILATLTHKGSFAKGEIFILRDTQLVVRAEARLTGKRLQLYMLASRIKKLPAGTEVWRVTPCDVTPYEETV